MTEPPAADYGARPGDSCDDANRSESNPPERKMHSPIDPERLLTQTAWVRRLAVSLARDEAGADDLVQDTFVAALRRPPPASIHDSGLRAWFAFVVRNLAFRRKREDYRREQRERMRPTAEASEAERHAQEQDELRPELIRLVRELPEGLRQVVLLRFFEELEPAEIARRLDLPGSTVRNRLRRALADLRERLERKHGPDWRSLGLFTPPAVQAGPALAPKAQAGLAAGSAAVCWYAGALGTIVLAGWLGWRRVPAQTADPEAIAWVEPVQPGSTASTAVLQSQTAEPDREAVSVRTPVLDAPELATPLRTRLQVRGTVRDEEHRPVSEAEVRWIDDLGRATRSSLYEGAYLVPDLQLGHYLVQVSGVRWRLQEFDVELPSAPAFQERELRVQANPELLVRVRERDGRAWPHCDGERRTLLQCLQVHLSRTAPAEELQSAASLDESNAGLGTFLGRRPSAPSSSDAPVDSIGTLELAQDPPAFVSLALGTAVVASARVERVSPEIAFTLALEDLRANFAGLRLRIVRADDRTPVANASAWLDANGHTSFHASRTDAQGRLEIADIPPGLGELSLQGPNRVRRDLVVRFQRGRVLDLGDVVLASQPRQPVRLEFPGDPQPVRFALESEVPGSVPARFDTGDAFQFELEPRRAQEIPFPGRGAYVLRVLSVGGPKSDGAGSLGGLPQRIVFGDRPESEIAVKIEPTTEICLRPARDALGNSRWLVSTADGLPCQCVQVEGRAPTRIALPQGAYTIGRIDPDSARPGTLQPFTVDAEFRVLDLFP